VPTSWSNAAMDQIKKPGNLNPKRTIVKLNRHVLPSGFKKLLVRNAGDLELLMMNNRRYCGELAANIGGLLRKQLVQRAAELGVNLTNGKGKVAVEEKAQE
jgi:large subunit ribosomal protein L32e